MAMLWSRLSVSIRYEARCPVNVSLGRPHATACQCRSDHGMSHGASRESGSCSGVTAVYQACGTRKDDLPYAIPRSESNLWYHGSAALDVCSLSLSD